MQYMHAYSTLYIGTAKGYGWYERSKKQVAVQQKEKKNKKKKTPRAPQENQGSKGWKKPDGASASSTYIIWLRLFVYSLLWRWYLYSYEAELA